MTDLPQPRQRLLLIDALRGIAIAMMVAFHFCFDLSYFGLADFNFYEDSFWLNARTLILSSFLFLVGVSLVLATRSGLILTRYLRRLGYLLAAALLVSVATWWMFAERFVFFGVLHFIALASVLGGLVRCPVIAVPTSVGYGASFGGVAALLAMLNSCASGVSVVNIDNGFGGGYNAAIINRLVCQKENS